MNVHVGQISSEKGINCVAGSQKCTEKVNEKAAMENDRVKVLQSSSFTL